MGVTTSRTRSFGAGDNELLVPGQLGTFKFSNDRYFNECIFHCKTINNHKPEPVNY